MASIEYKIEFFTDWHCGSGLAAGADVDALVVKDSEDFPFVPGKTIKGLVREAIEVVCGSRTEEIKKAFGFFLDNKDEMQKGVMFFENAELQSITKQTIKKQNTTKYLYRTIASTAIDENGISKEHSLRRLQVVVPCALNGVIHDVPDDLKEDITRALKYIKRLGVNRNRGLGRCMFSVFN